MYFVKKMHVHFSRYHHNTCHCLTTLLIRCYKQRVTTIVTADFGEVKHETLGYGLVTKYFYEVLSNFVMCLKFRSGGHSKLRTDRLDNEFPSPQFLGK
jgi:hypothetical protein